MNAHPIGCSAQVDEQIAYVKSQGRIHGTKSALIIGSSTGYGLASRIVAAFGCEAPTVGVFYERPGAEKRTGTAGWYNTNAFDQRAKEADLAASSINGDAFSDEIMEQVTETIRSQSGTVDLVVYSLASPVRTDPATGVTYRSVIKPIGEPFESFTADPFTGELTTCNISPATPEEIESTIQVMGGSDWRRWIEHLRNEGVLAKGVKTVAYSYIGPPSTKPMYRNGTIGRAKVDLEATADGLSEKLSSLDGSAYISVNKALVTRASAVIPVVPLYIALLYRAMKAQNIHEDCIRQMQRLFADRLYSGSAVAVDDEGRIRMDDREMRADIQKEVDDIWQNIEKADLSSVADFEGYRKAFLQCHGFDVDGVDYEVDVTV